MFVRVDEDLLHSFSRAYKGSEEELADLKAAYISTEARALINIKCYATKHAGVELKFNRLCFQGDMGGIIDTVMCSNVHDDEDRFRTIISNWIAAGVVPAFDAFTNEHHSKRTARKSKADKEAKEAEKLLQEITNKKKGA